MLSKPIFEDAHDSSLRKLLAPLLPAMVAEVRIGIHRLTASGTCSLLAESRGGADCCQTNIYSVTRRLRPCMLLVSNEVALAHSKDRDKQPRQAYMEPRIEKCTWCMDAVHEHMSAFRQTLLRRMWFPSLPNVHPTTRHKNCPFKEKFCHRWPKDMLMCRKFPSQGSCTLSHINSILLYAFWLLRRPVLGLGRAVASSVLSQPRSWQGFPTLE